MIDLNHIFLFLAIVSPLAVLVRGWWPGGGYRGWRIAAIVVLVVTGVAWIFFRPSAGYIGGGAWLALLFLPAIGLKRMSELSAMHKYRSARRLAAALRWLHPSAELREQIQWLRTLEHRQASGLVPPVSDRSWRAVTARPRGLRGAPAVLTFIVLNVLAFMIELGFGSSTATDVLHRLGALEPQIVVYKSEYWRLLTALFLHAGPVHLLFNLFALYVLGPPLERSIGTIRFFACYLISGLGSSAGVVALWGIGLASAGELVGASGCVMGVVGAWAGFLLLHRHAPLAKRRLANVMMIVVIQIAFDLSTPQISMSAHLCGLVTGFLVGLLISPRGSESRPGPIDPTRPRRSVEA